MACDRAPDRALLLSLGLFGARRDGRDADSRTGDKREAVRTDAAARSR